MDPTGEPATVANAPEVPPVKMIPVPQPVSPPTIPLETMEENELEQIESSVRRLREQRFMVEKLKTESYEKDVRIDALEAKVAELGVVVESVRSAGSSISRSG